MAPPQVPAGECALLIPVVPPEKQSKQFIRLITDERYGPARGMLAELYAEFEDPDGNFVEQFQSTGFDQRLWELCIYAYLRDARFEIDRSHPRPDFVASRGNTTLCIEAVTANPTQTESNGEPHFDEELEQVAQDTAQMVIASVPFGPDDSRYPELVIDAHRVARGVVQNVYHNFPIKLGSPLFSKLQQRYWEEPWVEGKPLILAIEDFARPGKEMERGGGSIYPYLFGGFSYFAPSADGRVERSVIVDEHKRGTKKIPSGWFNQPDVENISAVIYSNAGNIDKMNRMGLQRGYGGRGIRMRRRGNGPSGETVAGSPFEYYVGDPRYTEMWGEGLWVSYNPNARVPLARESLPGVVHTWVEGDRRVSHFTGFRAFWSVTEVLLDPQTRGE